MTDDMDKECISICDAINLYSPDFYTVESCCGHGKGPFRIFFCVNKLGRLPEILYFIDSCHSGFAGWHVEVYTDCAMSHNSFMLEGGKGHEAYKEADEIAKLITEYYKDKYD